MGAYWLIMAQPPAQRKNPFAQPDRIAAEPPRQSSLEFELLMARAAALLVQADLFLALGAALEARLAACLGAGSGLHISSPGEVDGQKLRRENRVRTPSCSLLV